MSNFAFSEMMKPETMMKAMPNFGTMMMMKDLPAMPVSPLMAHPVAATAAATALGFGMASHMMGLVLGSLEGAAEAARRMAPVTVVPADMPFGMDWMIVVARQGAEAATEAADSAFAAARTIEGEVVAQAEATASAAASAAEAVSRSADRATADVEVAVAKSSAAVEKTVAAAADVAEAAAGTVTRVARKTMKPAGEIVAEPKSVDVPAEKAAVKAEPAKAEPQAAAKKGGAGVMERPAEMARPATPDDLKRISGIGPKLEQVLNGLGIWTYGQVAGWSEAEIAWVEDYLQFKGRIARDDWQAQAAALASGA